MPLTLNDMAEQNTSIKIILDKTLRHPLMQDLSLETAVDYAVDFTRIVGVPKMFSEKVVELKTEAYRAKLPCDFYKIIQVKPIGRPALVASTDNFFMGGRYGENNNTYKIQGNIIYTSLENDTLWVSYLAIDTDKDGYPLIPDNSSFTRALELYIKKQWFTILFDMGKITPAVLDNTQREYAWAVGDCMTEFNRLSIDEMESFSNSWRTMIMRTHEHSNGFARNGNEQVLKV